MLQIETAFAERRGCRLSGQVPLKGASSDRSVTTGNESWNGNICDTLLDYYQELLVDVYRIDERDDNLQEYEDALRVWQCYALWLYVACQGCDDHDKESRYAHGKLLTAITYCCYCTYVSASAHLYSRTDWMIHACMQPSS